MNGKTQQGPDNGISEKKEKNENIFEEMCERIEGSKSYHIGNNVATIAMDKILDIDIVKCQLDCTMLPIHEIFILSICVNRMHR